MKLRAYALERSEGQIERGFTFYCPGCRERHQVRTQAVAGVREDGRSWPVWSFNGDYEHPTFTPSLWLYADMPGGRETLCHLWITGGLLVYCQDSPHALAGQTVPMPDIPDHKLELC